MKSRFSTIDITAVVRELLRFVSMRVMNVYDVDNKTYLIRLGKPDDKAVILLESGIRLHSTEFEWPKNPAPSGFSMKLRKHLKGKRLESIEQLGVDRIVDMTFGSAEVAHHVILELYDRGNIVLTDHTYTILNILRPRTDESQDVKFAVREMYPLATAKQHALPTEEQLRQIILSGKEGDPLKKFLIPHLDYGPAVIDHCLLTAGFPDSVRIGKGFDITTDMPKLLVAIEEAESLLNLFQSQNSKGYVTKHVEKRPNVKDGEKGELEVFDEFHPMLFKQYEKKNVQEYPSFNKAVDEFYSQMESQKIELKTLQQENQALKKLEHVKKDMEKRVEGLQKEQEVDKMKGQLIEMNLDMVDRAILIVRSAIANQIDWTEIHNLVKEAQSDGDPVAMAIKELKLATNHITMLLKNPYMDNNFEDDDEDEYNVKPMRVDIDLGLSAYSNSRKYFEKKKQAGVKEQKTMDASSKAFKSAERKTKQTLKEVATAASINKARKTYWFEKFLWFISSENFLVIGGRDQQQNELIVKRYMRQGDIYVHADLHGASSVIIKNHTGEEVPPKTLNEAGTMAICNSAAWDAKVVTSAWWVYPGQVSKTAPSGEYLTTGSFMIRGKKNFLPPTYLIYGFGLLFKLEESSVARHKGERRVRTAEEDDDMLSVADSAATEVTMETHTDSEDTDDDEESDDKSGNREKENVENVEVSNKQRTVTDLEENESKGDIVQTEHEDEGEDVNNACFPVSAVKTESVLDEIRTSLNSSGKVTKAESVLDEIRTSLNSSAKVTKAEPVVEFPDTEINLQYVKGDKYELSRSISNQSDEPEVITLGDGVPLTFGEKPASGGPKLSAKQRREMKKAKKQPNLSPHHEHVEPRPSKDMEEQEEGTQESGHSNKGSPKGSAKGGQPTEIDTQNSQSDQPQLKRRHKAKLKKMQEKYRDQDEEERHLRMEILASAGEKKPDKKKKGKKGEEKGRPKSGNPGNQQQQQKKKTTLVDIVIKDVEELTTEDADGAGLKEVSVVAAADDDDDRQEDESQAASEDVAILNSLSGIPHVEDELLFCVPVCAPYNALTNFKYKVKLLPGSTKRGKATKLALNMFQHDKNVTPREKDLLKILKDVDISRNIPGKVKVTAPNLQKAKKK